MRAADYLKAFLESRLCIRGEVGRLAEAAKLSQGYVSQIAQGDKNPTLDVIDRIAGAYATDAAGLFALAAQPTMTPDVTDTREPELVAQTEEEALVLAWIRIVRAQRPNEADALMRLFEARIQDLEQRHDLSVDPRPHPLRRLSDHGGPRVERR